MAHLKMKLSVIAQPVRLSAILRNYANHFIAPLARAKNLVSLYTVAEKINATGSTSPGVPRLGIPSYEWWSEGLHGIAGPFTNFSKSGEWSYSTSFPQPITMGAAFDDRLITDVATVISTEARAFNNANRTGLDFWTPNINPYRDPRWGRGQGLYFVNSITVSFDSTNVRKKKRQEKMRTISLLTFTLSSTDYKVLHLTNTNGSWLLANTTLVS